MRQVLADPARRLDEVDAVIIVLFKAGRDRKDVGIEDDVFRREVELVDKDVIGALADLGLARERIGLADLVERHHDNGGAVATRDLGLVDELVDAFLHRDRVHHRLALNAFQAGFDHVEFGRVDHHRDAGDVRLGGDEIEEGDHRGLRVQKPFIHVDVDDLRAVLDLVAGDLQSGGVVSGGHQLAEFRRAGDVGALADIDERNFRRQLEGFEARQTQARLDGRHDPRLVRRHGLRDRGDMVRRGAAAAADDVDEAGFGEFADQAGHEFRALVIGAEFIGQAGIRIGADQRVGDAADIRDMRAQILGAERAVESDGRRLGVAHRIPERFRQLAGQQAPGLVGDGAGDHDRHVDAARLADFRDGVEPGLGVQRVEDRLQQQEIGAAVQETVDLLAVRNAQIVEGDGAVAGRRHVRRDRGGAVSRADGASDEARFAVFSRDLDRGVAGEAGAFTAHLIGDVGEVVIGLRDRGRGEGVGGDDVGAGAQIFGVNVLDRLRLGQDQQIVVAAQVAVKILVTLAAKGGLVELKTLDHGAHGAVEHENALGCGLEKFGTLRRNRNGHEIRLLSARRSAGSRANG